MNQPSRLVWTGVTLAAAQTLLGIAMVFVPSPEGSIGGLAYIATYALPTAVIALGWGSTKRWAQRSSGWIALLMAAFYTAVAILNWGGYTAQQAAFVGAVTVPTVLFDLAVFWALAVRALNGPVSLSSRFVLGPGPLKPPSTPPASHRRDPGRPRRTTPEATTPGVFTGHEGASGASAQAIKRYKRSL